MTVSVGINRGQSTINAGLTRYTSISGILLLGTTEANTEIVVREAGTFGQFGVYLSADSLSGNLVVTLRKNGADTSATFTVSTGSGAGFYAYTGTPVSFAAGDKVSCTVVAASGSGSATLQFMRWEFKPTTDTNCITYLTSRGSIPFLTDNALHYMTPGGFNASTSATESDRQLRIRMACTSSNLQVKVASNARDTDTYFRTRKNGANGSQIVTATAGVAVFLEDTTHTDSLAVGDDFAYQIETQLLVTTNLNLTFELVHTQLKSTNGEFLIVASGGLTQAAAGSTYASLGGRLLGNATEANVETVLPSSVTIKEFGLLVTAHSLAAPGNRDEVYLRKNSASSAQVTAFSSGTGLKTSGTANPITSTAGGDKWSYLVDVTEATTGSITIQWTCALCSRVVTTLAPASVSLPITTSAPKLLSGLRPAAASLAITGTAPKILSGLRPASVLLSLSLKTTTLLNGIRPARAPIVFTGFAPGLRAGIVPSSAALVLTGFAPSLRAGISPAGAVIVLSGFSPQAIVGIIVVPSPAVLSITGAAPRLLAGLSPPSAVLSITGSPPAMRLGLSPPGASLGITGSAPVLRSGVTPAAANLVISGVQPRLLHGISPASGLIVVTGFAPQVINGLVLQPSPALLAILGFPPGLISGLRPGAATLVLAGLQPSLRTGLSPAAAELVLTGFPPDLVQVPYAGPGTFIIRVTTNMARGVSTARQAQTAVEAESEVHRGIAATRRRLS